MSLLWCGSSIVQFLHWGELWVGKGERRHNLGIGHDLKRNLLLTSLLDLTLPTASTTGQRPSFSVSVLSWCFWLNLPLVLGDYTVLCYLIDLSPQHLLSSCLHTAARGVCGYSLHSALALTLRARDLSRMESYILSVQRVPWWLASPSFCQFVPACLAASFPRGLWSCSLCLGQCILVLRDCSLVTFRLLSLRLNATHTPSAQLNLLSPSRSLSHHSG